MSGDHNPLGTYPFGSPLHPVVQTDRTPKKVFVLGVYAGRGSGSRGRWLGYGPETEGRCSLLRDTTPRPLDRSLSHIRCTRCRSRIVGCLPSGSTT
jgi:hypothetical protein